MTGMLRTSVDVVRDQTSAQLVEYARLGQPGAFDELMGIHFPRAFRAAFGILKNPDDAEDAVQDAMLNAYLHFDTFRGDSAFSTWLTRIVMNVALMKLRKRRIQKEISFEETVGVDLLIAELLASPQPSPERLFLEKEERRTIRSAASALSPKLRGVTLDRLREELPIRALADRHGITEAAVKSRLLRARQMIAARVSSKSRPN
jgi:RNA polymerase sigma-70 factor (ECF subfamily)